MKPDLNIHHLIPDLDLVEWERCLDEADTLADKSQEESAIFLDPQSYPIRTRLGLASRRPIGWKIVHVSQPRPTLKRTKAGLVLCLVATVIAAGLMLLQAVLNTT